MEEIEKTEVTVENAQPAAEAPVVVETAPVAAPAAVKEHENVIAGVVGAFLFGLGGVIAYVLIYRLGFIAGISGLITMVLCCKGYEVFSKSKTSIKGVVISMIMTLILICLAECISLGWTIYDVYGEAYHISFFDALRTVPQFLTEKEVYLPVIKDLAISILLSIVASIGFIKGAVTARKAEKAAAANAAQENAQN